MLGQLHNLRCSQIFLFFIFTEEKSIAALDDMIRHSLTTKMSSYHFSSTEEYRKRIIQMGEFPDRVVNVGSSGVRSDKEIEFFISF